MILLILIVVIFAAACESGSTGPDPNLPPDTARGEGLLLPWSEITGRITYASPSQLILVDGVRREVRTIRDAASSELFVDLASASQNSEVAVVSLLPDGSHRTTVIGLDGVVKRTVERAYCGRWLPDGRLSHMRGDTLFIEGAVMTVLNPQPWSCPSWSADGSYLLISLRDTVRRSQVYRIRVANTIPEAIPLTAIGGPRTSWDDPAIAPGGQMFAVAYSSDDPINEVLIANTGGGIIRKIGEGTRLYGLSWAPDGTQVLALSTVSSAGGLFLIRVSDGVIRRLVSHPVYAAAWGP